MGPVNWIAVVVAVLIAGGLALVWFGPLFGRGGARRSLAPKPLAVKAMLFTDLLLVITAAMLGHMFARVGADTLAAKPWLYFMMSGGLALAFVIPALLTSFGLTRVPARVTMIHAGYWLAAYLAMGLVFYLLG